METEEAVWLTPHTAIVLREGGGAPLGHPPDHAWRRGEAAKRPKLPVDDPDGLPSRSPVRRSDVRRSDSGLSLRKLRDGGAGEPPV